MSIINNFYCVLEIISFFRVLVFESLVWVSAITTIMNINTNISLCDCKKTVIKIKQTKTLKSSR